MGDLMGPNAPLSEAPEGHGGDKSMSVPREVVSSALVEVSS